MKDHKFQPESLMMSYAYRPDWSEGAIKCPVFQTSTFKFERAEDGKEFFAKAYGLDTADKNSPSGLIYSRLNHPDMEILERRLCLWDKADEAAVFSSGMAAISSVFLNFLKPGDLLFYSKPVYGGTAHFIEHYLPQIGVHVDEIEHDIAYEDLLEKIHAHPNGDNLRMLYLETPANPTNYLVDIAMLRDVANQFDDCLVAVDNTYLGPIWQSPLKQGADLVIYSATKFLGGHSDLIAGAVLGNEELIGQLKGFRTFVGNMLNPWECWLLMRSLETLKMRMEKQAANAESLARYLSEHPKVKRLRFLGLLNEQDGEQFKIYKKQCNGPGSMISMYINGGEKEAFEFLNSLTLIKLAVSLGATESLAQHPASMTHAEIPTEEKQRQEILPNLIRISVGVENINDLIHDIDTAFAQMGNSDEPTLHAVDSNTMLSISVLSSD